MFTGIIEDLGEITNIETSEGNITFSVKCNFTNELKIDQSVAHNGVCLTVIDIVNSEYKVTAIQETLRKTCIGKKKK